MGLLDVEHTEGQQQSAQQAHAGIIEPPAGEKDEHDTQHVEHGSHAPSRQVNAVIARLADNLPDELGHDHGKEAIDVGAVAVIIGVEGVDGGIKVFPERLGPLQAVLHHGQEALIGVQVLVFVPIQASEAQGRGHQQDGHHQDQHHPRIGGHAARPVPRVPQEFPDALPGHFWGGPGLLVESLKRSLLRHIGYLSP